MLMMNDSLNFLLKGIFQLLLMKEMTGFLWYVIVLWFMGTDKPNISVNLRSKEIHLIQTYGLKDYYELVNLYSTNMKERDKVYLYFNKV